MTTTEKLNYLRTKLHELDQGALWIMGGEANHKGGSALGLKLERKVLRKDDLHSILQPPFLQDKVRGILEEIGVDADTVIFDIKHYPEPTPDGKRRGHQFGDVMIGQGQRIVKDGGWRIWGEVVVEDPDDQRTLYSGGIYLPIELEMAPPPILALINKAIKNGTWTTHEHQRLSKCEPRLYKVGERVEPKRQRGEVPKGTKWYFVTIFSVRGYGSYRLLKVVPGKKPKFVSASSVNKVQEG